MELVINNKIFICLNVRPSIHTFINEPKFKFRIGLYFNAIDKQSNKKCIIYNRHKLNEYRLSQLTGDLHGPLRDVPGVDIAKCIELYKKDGYFRLPKKYLNSIGVNTEIKYDIDVIYNSTALKNIPFLPNILEINDNYVVYEIENGYNIPVINDMANNIEVLKSRLTKKTSCNGNKLYNKIIEDVVCFNYDSGRYSRKQQPFFECLKGMSIDYLSFENSLNGWDSDVLINANTNSWLYVCMHELLPNYIANSDNIIDIVENKSDMYRKLNVNYPKFCFKGNKIQDIDFTNFLNI